MDLPIPGSPPEEHDRRRPRCRRPARGRGPAWPSSTRTSPAASSAAIGDAAASAGCEVFGAADLLDVAVPFAAFRAAPEPLGRRAPQDWQAKTVVTHAAASREASSLAMLRVLSPASRVPSSGLDGSEPSRYLISSSVQRSPRPEEDRIRLAGTVQEVVPSARHIDRGGEVVPAEDLRVRGEVVPVEVLDIGREAQPVLQQLVVEPGARPRFDEARPQAREVLAAPAEQSRDSEARPCSSCVSIVVDLEGGRRGRSSCRWSWSPTSPAERQRSRARGGRTAACRAERCRA